MTDTNEEMDWSEYVTNIPEREEAANLLANLTEASEAWREALMDGPIVSDESMRALSAIDDECREAIAKIRADAESRRDAIYARDPEGMKFRELEKARDAAQDAYNDHPLALAEDDEGRPLYCALSGIPITDDDETVTVDSNGLTVIARLCLPAEVIEASGSDAEETEDAEVEITEAA